MSNTLTVYDSHVKYTPSSLQRMHRKIKLTEIESRHCHTAMCTCVCELRMASVFRILSASENALHTVNAVESISVARISSTHAHNSHQHIYVSYLFPWHVSVRYARVNILVLSVVTLILRVELSR